MLSRNIVSYFTIILSICFGIQLPAQTQSNAVHYSGPTPDYNQLTNWAAHPGKFDPSDRVPAECKINSVRVATTDVFFIHPTTFVGRFKGQWNASVDDEDVNKETDEGTILFQASSFNAAGKVYAPRYRQAHLHAFYPEINEKEVAKDALDLAYSDVKRAFLTYLEKENNGRPFIIASHSQGSSHAIRLIQELIDGKELQNKLVAAYLVGWPVNKNLFQSIKPCIRPEQTQCICSWRTFREKYYPPYIKDELPVIVTNPLRWDTLSTPASRELNKGAIITPFDKVILGQNGAMISNNILWTNKPKFKGSFLFTTKNYHIGDINLFYMNIRENAMHRVEAYNGKL